MAAELDPEWNIKVRAHSTLHLPSDLYVMQITLAEMGFFRTNFVKNHTYSVYSHPAYTNPNCLGNITRAMLAKVDPSMIKGDPDKLAKRLHELANLEDPPLHVLLGMEGPMMLKPKQEKDAAEREKYASWAEGLNFDE